MINYEHIDIPYKCAANHPHLLRTKKEETRLFFKPVCKMKNEFSKISQGRCELNRFGNYLCRYHYRTDASRMDPSENE